MVVHGLLRTLGCKKLTLFDKTEYPNPKMDAQFNIMILLIYIFNLFKPLRVRAFVWLQGFKKVLL